MLLHCLFIVFFLGGKDALNLRPKSSKHIMGPWAHGPSWHRGMPTLCPSSNFGASTLRHDPMTQWPDGRGLLEKRNEFSMPWVHPSGFGGLEVIFNVVWCTVCQTRVFSIAHICTCRICWAMRCKTSSWWNMPWTVGLGPVQGPSQWCVLPVLKKACHWDQLTSIEAWFTDLSWLIET